VNWLLWFGLIVATWRVTRLLIKDSFPPVKLLRDWIIKTFWHEVDDDERFVWRLGTTRWQKFWGTVGHSFAYVWTCSWCMSVWVSAALWWIAVWTGLSVPLPWLMMAAASGFSGLMGAWDARHDQAYEEAEKRLGR
jgi:Protein of unknown function (DUF1360)